ncbi:MAG: branched-chain amino acid ABC transporter permease/ATP-binding protein, partial [Actinobacteria bacterium]|nr:branched-chain amino acid ABC transporter permease/ATP-binding protein [Actinomycetota bacterium]
LDLAGGDPTRIRRTAWVVGCSFAALSGVLIAPLLGLDAGLLTLLVVQAFGAVAVGRFSSLPLAYVGGVIIGVSAGVLTKVVATEPQLSGLPSSVPFLVLFVVLVLAPPAARERTALVRQSARHRSRPRKRLYGGGLTVLAVVVGLAPLWAGPRLPVYTQAVVVLPVFLGLSLLTWASGQVSLCHSAFAGIGAATMGHLAGEAGLPWPVALVLAGVAVVPFGVIVAIPAIRLAGVYLALATFGFGILVEQVLFRQPFVFGQLLTRAAPRPELARGDDAFHFLAVAIGVLACALVVLVDRSRLGRLLRGLGDSPLALATVGVPTTTTRILAFSLSSFLAGISGAMLITFAGQASGRGFSFLNSLMWVTVLVVCGSNVVRSAVCAAFVFAVVPSFLPDGALPHQPLLFGTVAIVAALLYDGGFGRQVPRAERARRSPVRARTTAPRPLPTTTTVQA